tara:strand:- start:8471 stop:8827 length:357 start_codon:yes stop_codon:yes gene_type:complete
MFQSIDKGEALPLNMSRRLNIIHHQCVMCEYSAPLTMCSTQVERNCPKCDNGDNLKTMLPECVGREMGDKNTARYNTRRFLIVRPTQAEHQSEINERFPQFECFTDILSMYKSMQRDE